MTPEPDRLAAIAAVQAEHEADLMRYAHVVGVAIGTCTRGGSRSEEPCLVVFVDRKLPERALGPGALLPRELDGVPVDVVEVGRPGPQ
jgi:hypothetical protein